MAKVKALLKDASVEQAIRRRKCHRNRKHAISAGEPCLVVKDPASGSHRNYCAECAQPIVAKAFDDLQEIESMLYSTA